MEDLRQMLSDPLQRSYGVASAAISEIISSHRDGCQPVAARNADESRLRFIFRREDRKTLALVAKAVLSLTSKSYLLIGSDETWYRPESSG